ncbi:hypothetical protein [Neobacillus niacini]|uniref:hypothetical protein n=1 Tax=Neobacillus niacini TaxID=86668 RepID=UPI00398383F8
MNIYIYEFLEINFDYLSQFILDIKDLSLFVSFMHVNLEYSMEDKGDMLLSKLLEDWVRCNYALTEQQFIKLLWNSSYYEKDQELIELVPCEFLAESVPGIKLYTACYDAMNGDAESKRRVQLYKKEFIGLFSPIERVLIQEKIKNITLINKIKALT